MRLREEDSEAKELVFYLYGAGLTTEQVGELFDKRVIINKRFLSCSFFGKTVVVCYSNRTTIIIPIERRRSDEESQHIIQSE